MLPTLMPCSTEDERSDEDEWDSSASETDGEDAALGDFDDEEYCYDSAGEEGGY